MKRRLRILIFYIYYSCVFSLSFGLFGLPHPAYAAGVVTDCSSQAGLEAALSGGGLVTFSCGSNPVTIPITSTIEIRTANTTIDGGGKITLQPVAGQRVFLHRSWADVASTLTLKNLTITGAAVSGPGADANGAAIRSVNNSFSPPNWPQTLNIENVTFTNNISTQTSGSGNGYDFGGGAIFTQGGNLNVRNSVFMGNKALGGAGGAIHGLRSNITLDHSTFSGNQATATAPTSSSSGYGGALYVDGALSSGGGKIIITNSSFDGNSAANQGGFAYVNLYTAQNESLTIDRSRFVNHTVSGGAMGLGGALSGGGTRNGSGDARVTITNSLFHNNTVEGGARGASGGALAFAQEAIIVIANSTFKDNQARGVCLDCWNANGGAIYIVNNTVPYTLTNLTITGNYAGWVGGGITASTNGVLRNSIVAGNTASNGGHPWNIQQNCGQTIASGGNNLQWPALHPTDGNDKLCTSGTPIADPKLGALSDQGGPTHTIPLLAGSPAINAGDNTACTNAPVNNLDQRGLARVRPGNTVCDIGAYEANAAAPGDTIGVFRPSTATFLLRNANTTGPANISLVFGTASDLPVVGDWNGDGVDTVGVYRPSTAQFFLRDSNAPGAPVAYAFTLGVANDLPFAGDWDGDGRDGVGVFRPSNGQLYLKNALSTGFADFAMVLGVAGDRPVAGDWNGDTFDSPGVYRPSNSRFYLTDRRCNCIAYADYQLTMGTAGDVGFAGDWNGDGRNGVGVFRPSSGLTYLRNALTTGPADVTITYGIAGDRPVAGRWAVGPLALHSPSQNSGAAPMFEPPK